MLPHDMPRDRLGPLPEPAQTAFVTDSVMRTRKVRAYTADQMHAYALQERAAERERCAKACQAIEAAAWALWKMHADPNDQGRSIGAQECSDAIERAPPTRDKLHGDGSPHEACPKCQYCVHCGDCAEFGCGKRGQ
jgi:GNAT superfamily N-acetyltransferase